VSIKPNVLIKNVAVRRTTKNMGIQHAGSAGQIQRVMGLVMCPKIYEEK